MELGLKGKAVAITGGTTGIGLACAMGFLAEGCRVAVCGRSRDKIEAAIDQAGQAGYKLVACAADVAKESDVRRFAAETAASFGGIDVWVNNAGIITFRKLVEMSVAEWDELMHINVRSVFLGSRVAFEHMRERGGVILNASSFAAVIPSAGIGAYAATKAAILSLTRTAAAEFAPYGVRVNAYMPGGINTGANREMIPIHGERMKAQVALNVVGEAGDVVPAVLFLASDLAGYITGTALDISGGKFCVQNPHQPWEEK